MHGPLGGWFVWTPPESGETGRPVQLIAGGSGVVPMVAIVRAHVAAGDATPMRLLYSVRGPSDVFYAKELAAAASTSAALEVTYIYTREAPPDAEQPAGRITRERFAEVTIPAAQHPVIYVCGATPFVESVIGWSLELGNDPKEIRAERYGGGS